jgi:hypothetical protein
MVNALRAASEGFNIVAQRKPTGVIAIRGCQFDTARANPTMAYSDPTSFVGGCDTVADRIQASSNGDAERVGDWPVTGPTERGA